mmetsp:Transcript_33827/g.80689  ORF Transcript_33827/g.80689 Transcript_33827/m.80689 type:complete len:207 (-) Transcript_33827:10-630(-)
MARLGAADERPLEAAVALGDRALRVQQPLEVLQPHRRGVGQVARQVVGARRGVHVARQFRAEVLHPADGHVHEGLLRRRQLRIAPVGRVEELHDRVRLHQVHASAARRAIGAEVQPGHLLEGELPAALHARLPLVALEAVVGVGQAQELERHAHGLGAAAAGEVVQRDVLLLLRGRGREHRAEGSGGQDERKHAHAVGGHVAHAGG